MQLDYITFGRFSGSATALQEALQRLVNVRHHDLTAIARHPRMLRHRLAARAEAGREPNEIPWSKTEAWSKGLQQEARRRAWIRESAPALFVQTMGAFLPPIEASPYYIYTDRLAHERLDVDDAFTRGASRAWLMRERAFVKGASRVFLMGQRSVASALRDYGLNRDRFVVVGAGPNAPPAAPRQATHCRTVLFVGTTWEAKGGPELLSAFEAVSGDHQSLRLVLVGVEPPGELPRNVEVAGHVPHSSVTGFYANADLLVIPSRSEAYGIALTEALLSGVPCIATALGNQPSIVGEAGVCVRPGDASQLEQALREVVSNYPKYKGAAMARGERMRTVWSWGVVARLMVESMKRDCGLMPG